MYSIELYFNFFCRLKKNNCTVFFISQNYKTYHMKKSQNFYTVFLHYHRENISTQTFLTFQTGGHWQAPVIQLLGSLELKK